MKREDVVLVLSQYAAELKRLDVKALSLFGSAARGEAGPESDLDFLVEFNGPTKFAGFMDLKLLLEDTFGVKVDLATSAMIRPEIEAAVRRDLTRVA